MQAAKAAVQFFFLLIISQQPLTGCDLTSQSCTAEERTCIYWQIQPHNIFQTNLCLHFLLQEQQHVVHKEAE